MPPAISVQLTPLLVESFCTLAFNETAAAPTPILEMGLMIVTCTEEPPEDPVTVNESVAEADVFATEVAVIVGVLSGEAGTDVGGV